MKREKRENDKYEKDTSTNTILKRQIIEMKHLKIVNSEKEGKNNDEYEKDESKKQKQKQTNNYEKEKLELQSSEERNRTII